MEKIETKETKKLKEAEKTNGTDGTKATTFNSLTPDILEENKQVYTEALDYAFSNDDIRNIAITGVYGAGKSTVWNTYREYKVKKLGETSFKNIITVSLGKYEKNSKEIGEDNSTKDDSINYKKNKEGKELDNRVERQIINQISAQIKPSAIPLSNYKFKGNIPWYGLLSNIFLTLLFSASILFLVYLKYIFNYLKSLIGYTFAIVPLISIFIILFVGPSVYFLYHFYKKNKVRFSKFSFKVAEAELTEANNDETVLERDMKEIVYLLSSSNTSIVVFEDLDRYDSVEIFVKLKELNFLLNSYLETNEKNRVVKFVYLIKDGLFHTKDRTKFFDFILPIIPVVDSNTSEGHLLSLLGVGNENEEDVSEQNNEETALRRNDLRNISLYIDDMRVLRNIVNEYKVYSKLLQVPEEKLDENKLFALITVKNIYPKEFDLLQENRGYISGIFNKLEDYRNSKIEDINIKISKYISDIEKLNNIFENSKFEVLASGIPSYIRLDPAEEQYWPNFLKKWSENKEEQKSIYSKQGSSNYHYEEFLEQFIDKLDEKIELGEKVSENREEQLNSLKEEKISLERQLNRIKIYTLKELLSKMTSEEIEKLFECNEGPENQEFTLIRYLLIEGLFDETYWYYKCNFDAVNENTLKLKDRIYMRRLLEKSGENVLLDIESPNEIFNRLKSSDYIRYNVLNFKLLEVCVKKSRENESENEKILNMIMTVSENKKYKDLIRIFNKVDFTTTQYCVGLILENNIDLIGNILKECDEDDGIALNHIVFSVILNDKVSTEMIEPFKEFIENNEKVIELVSPDNQEEFIRNVGEKNIKFVDLQDIRWEHKIMDQLIYQHSYKLNVNNLICIANNKLEGKKQIANLFDTIVNTPTLKSCKEYVEANFEEFVIDYIAQYENHYFVESYAFQCKILKSNITDEDKIRYLEMSKYFEIPKLIELGEGSQSIRLVQWLFDNGRVFFKAENLNHYWELLIKNVGNNLIESNELNSFVSTMNKICDKINNKWEKSYTNDSVKKVLSECKSICNILLNVVGVKEILFGFVLEIADEPIEELNSKIGTEKIKALIEKKLIQPNENNIKVMVDNGLHEELKLFVELNQDKLISILCSMELSDEIIYTIVNAHISTDNAKSLITNLEESVQIDKISPEKTELIEFIQNENL